MLSVVASDDATVGAGNTSEKRSTSGSKPSPDPPISFYEHKLDQFAWTASGLLIPLHQPPRRYGKLVRLLLLSDSSHYNLPVFRNLAMLIS